MRLDVAIEGDLARMFAAELDHGRSAAMRAMRRAGEGLKADLSEQVTGAGLGPRLARTWKASTYPIGTESLSPAALVSSKAPEIIRAFEQGAVIRSKDGRWLAIPTENAPQKGVGGKPITPSNFPEHSLGRLRFVFTRRRFALLVVDDLRQRRGKRGGVARASAKAIAGGKGKTIVMFVLVPQVSLKKRLDVRRAAEEWQGRLPAMLQQEWDAATPSPAAA